MAKRIEKYPEVVYRKHPKPLSPHPSPWVRQPTRHLPLFIALASLACGLIAVDVRYGFSWLVNLSGTLSSPLVTAVDLVMKPVSKSANFMRETLSAKRENQDLKSKVAALEAQIDNYESAFHENQRLRSLLDLKAEVAPEAMAAEVLRYEDTPTRRLIRLRGGSGAGFTVGQTVLSRSGQLLGRIDGVSGVVSTVRLITDPACRIGVAIERTGAQGILYNREGQLFVRLDRTELVSSGDRVLTSHLSDLYPKGLLIGKIQGEADPTDTDPLVAVQLGLMKCYRLEPVFPSEEWIEQQEVLCLPNFALASTETDLERP